MDPDEGAKGLGRTVFDCLSPRCGTVLAAVTADIIADGLNPFRKLTMTIPNVYI
jgi:hypothetical protein